MRTAHVILIVDDNPEICRLMTQVLELEGFPGASQTSGEGALRWLEDHHADLILLDFMMPQMNGLEFVKALRADQQHADTPIFLVSAATDGSVQREAMALGVKSVIPKGDTSELISRVMAILPREQS